MRTSDPLALFPSDMEVVIDLLSPLSKREEG